MPSHPSNPFMAHAIDLSIENVRSGRGGPFAALVVKQDRIIAEGTNLVTAENDPTAHAEIVAIRRACRALGSFQLTDCEIYASCEPCPMCLGAIYWARPVRVFFASSSADASSVGFDDCLILADMALPQDRRRIPMVQIMRDAALEALRSWQAKPDKIPY